LELIQVCIGEFQVTLVFHADTDITIEGVSEIVSKDRKISRIVRADKPDETKEFIRFIGSTITEAANLGRGSVRLDFSSGDSITLFDSKEEFESYQISSVGREEIIV
jgi:hypothetical protein